MLALQAGKNAHTSGRHAGVRVSGAPRAGSTLPMDVVVAGAHGQIALLLHPLLTARGDRVRGIVRNPDHAPELEALGVEPVVCDLERATVADVAAAIEGADALVFAAGAGPGSGAARKASMDRDGAVLTIAACEQAGVPRYVMVGAMGTDDPPRGDDVFEVYLRSKAEADAAVMASGLSWTVVRPGRLTDEEPTGLVRTGRHVPRGDVPRADVAGVLAAVLADPDATAGQILELTSGDTPVADALRRAA